VSVKTVTAADDIEEKATLFGWRAVWTEPSALTCYRGDTCIQILFSANDTVTEAAKFNFYRIDELRQIEQVSGKFKREKVLAWLAE
jgi:hypothetical protein